MTEYTMRQVEGQEMLDILYWLDNYAFHQNPPFPDRASWDERITSRKGPVYFAGFEDGEPVTVCACPTLVQNVRGKVMPMCGFADVSSHPRIRRKGYIFLLMRHAFAWMKDAGYGLSSLYPFRESFYQRLGYVTFPQARKALFHPRVLRPLLEMELPGEIEQVLIGEGYETYHAFVKEQLLGVHGMAMFADPQKESAQSNRSWLALAKINGSVEGVMSYSLAGEQMMEFTFRAVRFYYRNAEAKYLLLNWIARHIDQANRVELWLPPYEQPNTWLADMDVKLDTIFVSPMGRVMDVSNLDGLQVGEGALCIEVVDPDCPWNEGIWELRSEDGYLKVSRGKRADARISINALSALVYGTNDPADFALRGWGEVPVEVQEVMRRMFPKQLPYLHEFY